MNRPLKSVPDDDDGADLAIGDLAERTGVTTATLRVWEARYGFPVPQRRASGHRRYSLRDVALVVDVVRRRDAGTRLDVAIEQALSDEASDAEEDQSSVAQSVASRAESVYAQLRRTHPELMPHRLRKRTLYALSRAVEDEFCAQANQAHLFAAFQQVRHYRAAQDRWQELARTSSTSYVFADFDTTTGDRPTRVALAANSPMRREWSVVCDSPDFPVAVAAWEVPGQTNVPDFERRFESVWTVDPIAVREASRVCARVAAAVGAPGADEVVSALAAKVRPAPSDPLVVTSLFNRVIAYTDTPPR